MSIGGDLEAFLAKLERRKTALFVNTTSHVEMSIKSGSEVTGAPGQPVASGNLLNSWHTEIVSPTLAETTTACPYAPSVENAEREDGTPIQFRSEVGGAHSVKLTRAGWPRIVDHEAEKLGA